MVSGNLITIIITILWASATMGFLTSPARGMRQSSMKMMIPMERLSLFTAELYAGPTATYNGELIDKTLKLVESVPKPAGYEYGAVSTDGLPILFVSLIAVISLAAFVPAFLSAGESAKVQQKEFEKTNNINFNEFKVKDEKDRKNKSIPKASVTKK
eukprot:gene7268-9907_t